MSLDIYKFYQRCLVPLTPQPAVIQILSHYLFGAETTDDFSKVLALDNEIQNWIRVTVQRLGFHKAKTLNQMVELLGQNRVRDVVIGRHIERQFVPDEESILAKMVASKGAEAPKEAKTPVAAEAPAPAAKKAQVTERYRKDTPAPSGGEGSEDSGEAVPTLSEFNKYLEFANQAEQIATQIRNSYPGQAYAGGVLFDSAKYLLLKTDVSQVTDARLKDTKKFIEEVFKDGIRCGIAANEIIQKISIAHQKTVFVTALVHNIGKILLFAYDPMAFEKTFIESQESQNQENRKDSVKAEEEIFDFDHAQAGALYVGRVPFLAEIERSIDYHHNPHFLKFSNPSLYALSCVLTVSGALVKLYQANRSKNPKIDGIHDKKLVTSPAFSFLKLSLEEWEDIKRNYALKLNKIGF